MATIDELRIRRLLAVGQSLMSELELDVVLERVLAAARDLTGAPYAAIGVLDETRTGFGQFVAVGIDEQTRSRIGSNPKGRGVLGVLISDPRPLRLSDVSSHPESYGYPAAHPPMRALLGVPLVIRGEVWGNLYLSHDDASEFSEADEESVGMLAEWAAAAIGNALLYETSERRRTELERAVRELEATRDVLLAIGASGNLNHVLELIAKRGRALIDAHSVMILLREQDELVVAASAGHTIDIGVLSREHAPSPPESEIDEVQELLVPMLHRGESIGMLAAARSAGSGRGFNEDDEQVLVLFAATAATAVAMAQVAEADRLRSSLRIAEAERRRWARELHDETLQGLGAMRLQLAAALKRGGGAAEAGPAVHEVLRAIDHEIQNLRTIITDLRPAALDELGLRPALEALVERRASDGLAISSELELPDSNAGDARLDPELEIAIYRIVQEGLTNVVKHAHATAVRLSVAASDDQVSIELSDDGVGFDPLTPKTGFGLAGIQERINLVGGNLELESGPAGTVLRASLRGKRRIAGPREPQAGGPDAAPPE